MVKQNMFKCAIMVKYMYIVSQLRLFTIIMNKSVNCEALPIQETIVKHGCTWSTISKLGKYGQLVHH